VLKNGKVKLSRRIVCFSAEQVFLEQWLVAPGTVNRLHNHGPNENSSVLC